VSAPRPGPISMTRSTVRDMRHAQYVRESTLRMRKCCRTFAAPGRQLLRRWPGRNMLEDHCFRPQVGCRMPARSCGRVNGRAESGFSSRQSIRRRRGNSPAHDAFVDQQTTGGFIAREWWVTGFQVEIPVEPDDLAFRIGVHRDRGS